MRNSMYIGYNGKKEAYIYIWFSKKYKLVYVGETNNKYGVLGRGIQHLKNEGEEDSEEEKGTLYKRVYEKGYDIYEINDFMLLSYSLPREKRFLTKESSWRISVEFLVQHMLIEKRINVKQPYQLISSVQPGQFIDVKYANEIAESIVDDFLSIYTENDI